MLKGCGRLIVGLPLGRGKAQQEQAGWLVGVERAPEANDLLGAHVCCVRRSPRGSRPSPLWRDRGLGRIA